MLNGWVLGSLLLVIVAQVLGKYMIAGYLDLRVCS